MTGQRVPARFCKIPFLVYFSSNSAPSPIPIIFFVIPGPSYPKFISNWKNRQIPFPIQAPLVYVSLCNGKGEGERDDWGGRSKFSFFLSFLPFHYRFLYHNFCAGYILNTDMKTKTDFCQNSNPFVYHFGRKGTPFIYLLLKKKTNK